jgi:transposase
MIFPETKAWLFSEPTDMRKAIDGLSILTSDFINKNPSNGELFIFWNKKLDKLKILYWHINGFIMVYKRLEQEYFYIPGNMPTTLEVSTRELGWLLDGLDFSNIKGHKKLSYSNFC